MQTDELTGGTKMPTGNPTAPVQQRAELAANYGYAHFLFWGVALIAVYLPVVLRESGYQAQEIGFLLATYNIVGLLSILAVGRLLDLFYCYRAVVFGGAVLIAFAFTRLFFWQQFSWSLFAVIVLALGYLPQVSTMDSYISMRYPVHSYGRIRSVGSLGYILFLGLAALFQIFTPFRPQSLQFWVWGLYSLVSLLFFGSTSWASRCPKDSARQAPQRTAATQKTGIQVLGWPVVLLLLALVICWALVMGVNNNFLAIYLRDELQQQNISLFFMLASSSEVPIIFWGGRILYRKPLGLMLLLGFAAGLLRLLVYATLPYPSAVLIAQLLHALAYGLFHITVIAIVNYYFTRYRSTAIAIYASIPPLGGAFGALLGGFIIQHYGFPTFFWSFIALVLPVLLPVFLLRRRFLYL